MANFKELLDKANQNRKTGNFKEASKFYKELWENYRSKCNEWVAWGYALTLSKIKQNEKAIQVCEDAIQDFPDFENLKNVYAWALYNEKINIKKIKDIHEYLKVGELICSLVKPDASYSPYNHTVQKVLENLEKSNLPEKFLQWIERIDLEQLPKDPVVVKQLENRVQTVPSRYEALLKSKIDALIKLRKTAEAAQIAEHFLNTTPKEKISSKTPFQYAVAHHYLKSGDLENAYIWFKRFVFKKKKWQYHKEMAEVFYRREEYGDALKLACDAAVYQGDYKKKTPLFVFMAALFRKLNKPELAKKHLELALAIRKELNLNSDNFSKNLVEEFGIDLSQIPDSKKLWFELRKVWEQEKYSALPFYHGKIILLIDDGFCGFVGLDNGNTYYFRKPHFLGDMQYLRIDQPVQFQIELAINPKKDKANKVAVNVMPLDEKGEVIPYTPPAQEENTPNALEVQENLSSESSETTSITNDEH